jgi:hypothetical protein
VVSRYYCTYSYWLASYPYARNLTGNSFPKEAGGGLDPNMADPGVSVYNGLPTGWAYPKYAGLPSLIAVHTIVDGS